jgi:hypothetical protein
MAMRTPAARQGARAGRLTAMTSTAQPRRDAPAERRVSVGLLCCGLAALLVAVAGVAVWRWEHNLHLFPDVGNGFGAPMPVGQTRYALAFDDPGGPVHAVDLRTVSPSITTNSARATIRVLQCTENGGNRAFGAVSRLDYCRPATPFRSGPHPFGAEDLSTTAIVLAITAHRAGVVRIDGVHITYRRGLRHGEQTVGIRMTFRVR